ncbi:MAG: flippase [Dorea formicigenerans]|nr:flippase [Dorea formicigenerans]
MSKKKTEEKSVAVNLMANGIKTLMSVLFPLITFPYASRILGATGIGKVNYANSIISYFSLVAALGINTYAVREGARIRNCKEKFDKFAKEMLRINIFTTLVTYIAFCIFLCMPVLEGYKILLVIFSLGMWFTTFGMEWLFIIKEEYEYITKRAILFQFVSLILLFLLVRKKEDYVWYAALTVISSGGSAILNLWHSRKLVTWKKRYEYSYRRHIKPILVIFGTSIASNIYMTMDTTMLGTLQGDKATGIYTAASKINLVISTVIGTVSSTILPRVSYYIGNDLEEKYKELMKTSVNMLLLIAMPASIGMMCTSDILILLFSGSEFVSGTLAAQILAARVVVGAINRILAYQICIPYKKEKDVLVSTIAGAIFNLIANAILIPLSGVNGAAVATLCSELVVFGVLTFYSNKSFDTWQLYRRLPIYLVTSVWFVVVRVVMNIFVNNALIKLIAVVCICSIGYFGILLLMKDICVVEGIKMIKYKILKRKEK